MNADLDELDHSCLFNGIVAVMAIWIDVGRREQTD